MKNLADRLDWPMVVLVLGLAGLATALVLYGPEEVHAPVAGLLVTLAGVMRGVLRALPPPGEPPDHGAGPAAGALVVLLAIGLAGSAGCGASALRTHATVGTVASVAVASTAPLVPATCDARLAACRGDAACVDQRTEECRIAAAAHDATRVAVRAYLDGIEVASLADEGLVSDALRALLAALLARWAEASAALERVGVELPSIQDLTSRIFGGAS